MKTYYADNFKPAPPGMRGSVLQVVKQLTVAKAMLSVQERKRETVELERKARADRLRYHYDGLKR